MKQLFTMSLCIAAAFGADAAASAEAAKCTTIDDARARLACYDAAFGRKETPAAAEAQFGMNDALRREQSDPGPEEMTAVIKEATQDARGYYTITLENGQRWRFSEPTRYQRLEPGEEATIRRASFGSHLFRAKKGGPAVRVKRIE